MSYSSNGFLTSNSFIYWGNIQEDWIQFIRRIDPRDYLWKARLVDEFTRYLDSVQFVSDGPVDSYDCESLDWDWFLSRHGKINHCFSVESEEWNDFDIEILFPLSRNKFPFYFMSEKEIEELVEGFQDLGNDNSAKTRDDVLGQIPSPFECEEDLAEFVRDTIEIESATEYLGEYNLKICSPEPKYGDELKDKNFDEHMGLDALLAFLARAGVVNKYFRDWMVTCHMMGEDGEEFSIVKKISGNEVIDPNQRKSSW